MMKAMTQVADRALGLKVMSEAQAQQLKQDRSERFVMRVPAYWRSSTAINLHAKEAEAQVIEWFERLGCTPDEMDRARNFDTAGYVGIPFPGLSRDSTFRMGKYLSLWLLWDDSEAASLESRWKIEAAHVITGCTPRDMTRFDEGWWELFIEFSGRRTWRWLQDTCEAMAAWNEAAEQKALWLRAHRTRGSLPTFGDELEVQTATIGMSAILYLLEDAYDFELPPSFHEHPTVKQLKKAASEIVCLGKEIFGFAKDLAEGQRNLVSTLMHERNLPPDQALEQVIRLHDLALERYDFFAVSLGSWGAEVDLFITQWLQDVRYASLGFSLWEAQASRHTSHKMVMGEQVVAPSFRFVGGANR